MESSYDNICDEVTIASLKQKHIFACSNIILRHSSKKKSPNKKVRRHSKVQSEKIVGRVPLWFVSFVAGMAVLTIVSIFIYGSYVGLGSSL